MPIHIHPAVKEFYESVQDPPPVRSVEELQVLVNALSSDLKCPISHDRLVVNVEKFDIPTSDNTAIDVYWYTHTQKEPNGPAVVYYHGGGFVGGSTAMFDDIIRYYVLESKVSFLSVDYRLAPQHRYPVPQEDGFASLKWMHANSKKLNVDAARIAIMGDSAGGGLTASVAIINSRQEVPLEVKAQYLVYPMLDYSSGPRSETEFSEKPVWTHELNELAWTAILGDSFRENDIPDTAAPGRTKKVENLPPTHIVCGLLDIFRDDNVKFASKFWQSGLDCSLTVINGMPHMFDLVGLANDIDVQQTWKHRIDFLKNL